MKLDKHFPFKKMRNVQKDILMQIEPYLDDDNIKYIVIEAGTGIGKSAIAKTLSSYYKQSYLLTATKSLQEQYKDEFHNHNVRVIKSKSNYTCTKNASVTCDIGPCRFTNNKGYYDCDCPYTKAFQQAIESEMFITNYAYFLHYQYNKNKLPARSALIIDESHLIGEYLIDFYKLKVDKNVLKKQYKLLDGNVEYKDVVKWKKRFSINEDNNIYILQVIMEHLNNKMKHNDGVIKSKPKENKLKALRQENDEITELVRKIKYYIDTLRNRNWITKIKSDGNGLYAVPIFAKKIFSKMIEPYAKNKIIFMSATIFGKQNFCKELGLDPHRTLYIHANSTFDPKRSPIIILPCLSFRKGEYEQAVSGAVDNIQKIIDMFKDYKGIIHTGNYKILNFLVNKIKSDRFLYKKTFETNEYLIERHSNIDKNSILVSPSMMNGVDLKDDLSRFQIIMKLPYASLSDPRMRYFSDNDFDVYAIKMFKDFAQSCGRSTRTEDDWSVTFVLDSGFNRIFPRYRHLMSHIEQRIIRYEDFDFEKFQQYINTK